jgi:hypothetical protein
LQVNNYCKHLRKLTNESNVSRRKAAFLWTKFGSTFFSLSLRTWNQNKTAFKQVSWQQLRTVACTTSWREDLAKTQLINNLMMGKLLFILKQYLKNDKFPKGYSTTHTHQNWKLNVLA